MAADKTNAVAPVEDGVKAGIAKNAIFRFLSGAGYKATEFAQMWREDKQLRSMDYSYVLVLAYRRLNAINPTENNDRNYRALKDEYDASIGQKQSVTT